MVNVGGPDAFRPLLPVGPAGPAPLPPSGPEPAPEGKSFKDLFQEQLAHVNELQLAAEKATEQLVLNPNPSPAEIEQVMLATRKAELAFETLMQVRNKLVDAFEQLMQMRI